VSREGKREDFVELSNAGEEDAFWETALVLENFIDYGRVFSCLLFYEWFERGLQPLWQFFD
jgi:hypothetical protein